MNSIASLRGRRVRSGAGSAAMTQGVAPARITMPVPRKTLPPPASTINGSTTQPTTRPTAASRTPTSRSKGDGVKLLGYGKGKTGKTRLLASFRKPVLIIATQDGTKSVSDGKDLKHEVTSGVNVHRLLLRGKPTGVEFVRVTTGDQFSTLVRYAEREGYPSVGLDTAGELQDVILKDVLGLESVPLSKFRQAGKGEAWGITDKGTWGTIGTQFKERMVELLNLTDKHDTNVMIIAHERNFKEEGDSNDMLVPSVGAALTPNCAGWLNGQVDYICQTFIRPQYKTEKVETIEGEPPQDVQIRTGKYEYCLRVGPHDVFMTGFRLPDPEQELPDVIVNPTFDKILKLIKEG